MTAKDWESVKTEGIKHLQRLIRCDTSNPPGNEREAVSIVHDHDGLQDAVRGDRIGQLLQLSRVEVTSGLLRIRADCVERHLTLG